VKTNELFIGNKINRLIVVALHHQDKRWRKYYVFKCDCGLKKVIHGAAVVSGNTKSCGCLAKESKKARRVSPNHTEVTAIILGYKRHAINRGYKWSLKRSDVENIINKDCFYCGSSPNNRKITKNSLNNGLLYSGIDRIDSEKDYTDNNVLPCCKICNYAKSNMSIKRFKVWAIKLGQKAMAEQWG